jgi:hypothetical protein
MIENDQKKENNWKSNWTSLSSIACLVDTLSIFTSKTKN